MRAATSRRDKENGQSPEERRDVLFERIEELTGREFPRNQFPQQSDKYPDEANEAIRSLSDVLGAINSRSRMKCLGFKGPNSYSPVSAHLFRLQDEFKQGTCDD